MKGLGEYMKTVFLQIITMVTIGCICFKAGHRKGFNDCIRLDDVYIPSGKLKRTVNYLLV